MSVIHAKDTCTCNIYNALRILSFILAGGTFVRWGRKECPGNNTELVYSGALLTLFLCFLCIRCCVHTCVRISVFTFHSYDYMTFQALLVGLIIATQEQPLNLFVFPPILTSLPSTPQVTPSCTEQNTTATTSLPVLTTEMISLAVYVGVP